jgi:transposase
MMLTHQQVYELYWQGPEAVARFINSLYLHIERQEELLGHRQQQTITALSEKLARLNKQLQRVKRKLATQECLVYELTRRLQQAQQALADLQPQPPASAAGTRPSGKDSHNSSLPPSSDLPAVKQANALRRTRSLRRRTGKRVGGQAGHPGRTLLRVEPPDRVVVHAPEACRRCAASLAGSPVVSREKRQVFDLPVVRVEVTEHQAEIRQCLACAAKTKANFPARVKAPVQYGEGVRARALYLQKYQLLPFARTSEAMQDLFGCGITAPTLHNVRGACSRKLIKTEARIKAGLQQAAVIGWMKPASGWRVRTSGSTWRAVTA